jgi:hypothetical protein
MNNITNLTLIGCLVLLSGIGQFSHASESDCYGENDAKNCQISSFATNGHSFWLPGLNGVSSDFHFAPGTGIFKELAGGKAKVKGTLVNENDPTQMWTVMLCLAEKSDWNAWSANGGNYKDEQGVVTDANGCMVSDSGYVAPGGVGKTAKSTSTEATDIADVSFTTYPNPSAKGSSVWMAIENVEMSETTSIQIFDLTGQLVLSERHSIIEGSNKIELEGFRSLSAGSYIVRLSTGDQVITSRILVSN